MLENVFIRVKISLFESLHEQDKTYIFVGYFNRKYVYSVSCLSILPSLALNLSIVYDLKFGLCSRPVKNFDEVAFHYIECIYNHLQASKLQVSILI